MTARFTRTLHELDARERRAGLLPVAEQDRSWVCDCGHPFDSHEHVAGFVCSPGVTINGHSRVPDVWVCTGGRLVGDPENASPWDFVCGCVIHEPGPNSPRFSPAQPLELGLQNEAGPRRGNDRPHGTEGVSSHAVE